MKAIKFLHFNNILHRDLKPSNILVNKECFIKMCDFGSSTYLFNKNIIHEKNEYVASLWYRSPEVIWKSNYTDKSELWSLGCLISELYLNKPLFQGTSTIHQLELIISIMGIPTSGELESMGVSPNNQIFDFLNKKKTSSLNDQLNSIPEKALDLVKKLLIYNPKKRISLDEILKHKYINKFLNNEKDSKNLEMTLVNEYLNQEFTNTEDIIDYLFGEKIYIKKKHLIKNIYNNNEDKLSNKTNN